LKFNIFNLIKTSTFRYAFLGAILLWAALPPADMWPLAWFAPMPWVMLVRRKQLEGPRPYLILWLAGFAFWMAALHWLRLPYWATAFGWVALSFYFAFYLPVFIGLCRTAVHQLRVPVILAAPIVWTGLELARGHLLTGMTMASLGHTQYRWIEIIQISDLAGAYGVSFVVMFVAACLARMLPCEDNRRVFWPIAPASAVLLAVLGYGYMRTAQDTTTPGAKIALIQGSVDAKIEFDPDFREKMVQHYQDLSKKAVHNFRQVDLIVWPEVFFRSPIISYDHDAGDRDPIAKTNGITPDEWRRRLEMMKGVLRQEFAKVVGDLGAPMLIGLDSQHYTADGVKIYNSAALVSATGEVLGRYDKMHLVMFGEYTPFADTFPWIYNHLTPLSMSITPGDRPASFRVGGVRISPNICYESVMPHLIRRQINTLKAEGKEPDVLVNLTNDGWFWGSSELDMHLVCGVFRAVECRKPFLIAANTGFSAWIDANGRIIEKGPRRYTATLLAEVRVDHRGSWYLDYGDWPAGICLLCCGVFATAGFAKRFGLGAKNLHEVPGK
jgi:apolipoprotein N-acyltransferase